MRWLPVLLLVPNLALAERPPGDPIDPAIAVDITADGLNALDGLVGGLVPSAIPIPPIVQADRAPEDCIDLWLTEICWIPWAYSLAVTNFDAGIGIDALDFELREDEIALTARVTVNIAAEGDPGLVQFDAQAADVNLFGIQFTVVDIDGTCRVHLPPTPLTVDTTIGLKLDWPTPDEPVVNVDVAPVNVALDLSGLEIRDCFLGDLLDFVDAVNDFLGAIFSFDIYELLVDFVEPLLNDTIQGFLGDLEGTIQGLFTDLVIEQELDLLGAVVPLRIAPDNLVVRPEAIRFTLEGSIGAPGSPAACVAPYGITGSLATGAGVPELGSGPTDFTHALGAFVDDDLVNQALFALWYEGVLCFTLDSSGGLPIDLPIPLDTSLLRLLGAADFDPLFPEPKPIALSTRPRRPPEAAVGADGALAVTLEDLGLDLYAELDGRMARMVGLEIGADVGAGVLFDDQAGTIGVSVDLDAEALDVEVPYNELAPSASAGIQNGFRGLFGTLVGPLLGSALDGLAFPLPKLGEIGLSDVQIAGAGPDADWLGVYAGLGPVAYEGSGDLLTGGCSGEGGCAGGGCAGGGCEGGGCNQGGPTPLVWALPLLFVLRRRR